VGVVAPYCEGEAQMHRDFYPIMYALDAVVASREGAPLMSAIAYRSGGTMVGCGSNHHPLRSPNLKLSAP
jgi:hypothetical protein